MINVLVVVDGYLGRNVSFGTIDPHDSFFSLTYFMSALGAEPNFTVTKAHRGVDPGAPDPSVLTNFRFDAQPLSYDVIFLFGFCSDSDVLGSTHPQRLSDMELFALATFMQNGGGVFATGDHESLGRPLCGLLPRVRSMRKWYFPPDGGTVPQQFGEPTAPPAIGQMIGTQFARRLDTTMIDWNDLDPSGGNWFDDQSDDNPQILEFRFPEIDGREVCWEDPVFGSWGAHPVWYTTVGISREYPDHMHEGEILAAPWETDRVFTFNSTPFTEYPPTIGGGAPPPMPQIIAWSFSNGDQNDNHNGEPHAGDPNPSETRPFGAVGIYDGRPAGIGRILVDSTFHHYTDINLIGDPTAVPPKTVGFQTPSGQHVLDQMGQYYRNIVTWLAPPTAQMAVWHGMLSAALKSVAVREALPPAAQARSVAGFGEGLVNRLRTRLPEPILWALATANLDPAVVGAIASGMPDPCGNQPEAGVPVRSTIANYLVGATALAVLEGARKAGTAGPPQRGAAVEIIRAGQRRGLELLASESTNEAKRLAAWADKVHHAVHGHKPKG